MANIIQQLAGLGQSIWLDHVERSMITSGELRRMIAEGLLGMTSNPTIFEKAIDSGDDDYEASIRDLAARGASTALIAETVTCTDVATAADEFRGVHTETGGRDGYVSIEVSPRLAHDTAGTLAEARRLWSAVDRPNVMIKIPATQAGLPAIEAALVDGININVTLMFSMAHYEAVAEAYLRALERRAEAGLSNERIASVASFFVSRVDTLVDSKLTAIAEQGGAQAGIARSLVGKAGIANSRLVYRRYRELYAGERFKRLEPSGARRQRVLWASTSTKNPEWPDTLYVDSLVGPETVNTLPLATYAAVLDHGSARLTVDADLAGDREVVRSLESLGIDLGALGEQLSREGVDKFVASWDALLRVIETHRSVPAAG